MRTMRNAEKSARETRISEAITEVFQSLVDRDATRRSRRGQTTEMSGKVGRILRGSRVGLVPACSLAEYLLLKIKALPQKHVIQVEAESGAVQTVEEVLRMSAGVSEGLKKLGLRENDVVGLLCRNCFEASAVVLGAWLGGTPVCPMAGSLKPVEMKHVLKLTQPKVIFCEEEALGLVTASIENLSTPPEIIVIGGTEGNGRPYKTFQDVLLDVDPDSFTPRPIASPADQLVCIIFSSGTSGLPKGVGISHTNLIFQDMNMEHALNKKEIQNCLHVSQFFWITGILMFLRSLTTGITRVLMRDSSTLSLLKAIDRYKTDCSLMAPLVALSLTESPELDCYDVSSMKKLFVGGSPVTQAMIDKMREKLPTVQIIPCYGTTEATGFISSTEKGEDLTSVGKVSPGTELKIVDVKTGQTVDANSVGEILVRSSGVMKGYVRNEEATRDAIDEEGWCHTGDLGYFDAEGHIFIVDRIKEMIKITDMQVAPAEVENTILEIPGVAAAAVTGVTPDGYRRELAALVEKIQNSTVTAEDIRDHVAQTLSSHKRLTGGVYFIDNLPKTGSGKLQRREVNRVAQALYSSSCRLAAGESGRT